MDRDVKKDGVTVRRRVDSVGPGKNVLLSDLDADETATDETGLEVELNEPPAIDLSRGFDPYDTGSFYKKKD